MHVATTDGEGPPAPDHHGYLRRREAARYLGISIYTLRDLQRRRMIPFIKLGSRLVLFRKQDLDKALDRYRVASIGEEVANG